MTRLTINDVAVGDALPEVRLPLNVYRLVMAAGSNRDFNSIHHNTEYARSTGAQEMYANTSFLLTAWERLVRDWMGPAGRITAITGFRMKSFNHAGDVLTVHGEVTGVDHDAGSAEVKVWCENGRGVSVGPGTVRVVLPGGAELPSDIEREAR